MTNRALIDALVIDAATIWQIDPIDVRRSRGSRSGRARTAIAFVAYRHGCELHEILRGFERAGTRQERQDYREPVVRTNHFHACASDREYREKCLELMKAVDRRLTLKPDSAS